jgi:hypothetical protein
VGLSREPGHLVGLWRSAHFPELVCHGRVRAATSMTAVPMYGNACGRAGTLAVMALQDGIGR